MKSLTQELTYLEEMTKLSADGSSLNPEADGFHPMRGLGDSTLVKNERDSPVERESPVEGDSPAERNVPVEKDLPVEDYPGVESEAVQDESV